MLKTPKSTIARALPATTREQLRRIRHQRRQKHEIRIDESHAALLRSLVMTTKPRDLLELGFGAGESAAAILDGLRFNRTPFTYTLVDNWMDFDGVQPSVTRSKKFAPITFVTSGEEEYVRCQTGTFDFVFSDADHFRSQHWFDSTLRLARSGGLLAYHDVTNASFPNLRQIYDTVRDRGYRHALFDRSSRGDERCERGLLVIFKD